MDLQQILIFKFGKLENFRTSKDLYLQTGINKHRFAKILKGEKEATSKEIEMVCKYFNVKVDIKISNVGEGSE